MKKLLFIFMTIISTTLFSAKVLAADYIDYEDLFDNHKSVMLIIEPISGEIYYANKAAADFYGYSIEELLEMNIDQINLLSPEEIAAERINALEEDRNFFIFKHKLSNGDIRTVYVYSYPVEINGESYLYSIVIDQTDFVLLQNRDKILIASIIVLLVLGVLSAISSIIVLSRKSKNLKHSEQRFEALHNASFGGIVIHEHGKILECNLGLSTLTGYSRDELIGMDGLLLIESCERDFVRKKIQTNYELPYESIAVRKNGELFPVRIEARQITYKNRLVRVTEFRDITEIKEKEKIKQELENQWSKLIEEMPLGFNLREMIFDEAGNPIDYKFLSANDYYESITGLKLEAIIGKRSKEVLPDIEDFWLKIYAKTVKNKETIIFESYSKSLKKYFRVTSYPHEKNTFVVIVEDISLRKDNENKLLSSELEKSRIISSLPGVFYRCKFDTNWTMLFMSEACEELTGYKPYELIENNTTSFANLIVPKYRGYLKRKWELARELNQSCNIEYELIRKDGSIIWIWEKGKPFSRDGEWQIEGFLMDITQRKKYEETIEYGSNHDSLTGLSNREGLMNILNKICVEGNKVALIYLDIDDFKSINDTRGHIFGDYLIKKIADRLSVLENENIFVSRFQGDEFIIACNFYEKFYLDEFIERIQLLFKEKILVDDNLILVEFSAGISIYPNNGLTPLELLRKADIAMYEAKHADRMSFCFFDKKIEDKITRNKMVLDILNDAILNDNFNILYQPQINIDTKEIVGLEALLRINGSDISPYEFIPLAEQNRLINKIGKIVIFKVIEQLAKWTTEGYKIVPVFVNYSANQLGDLTLNDYISDTLKQFNVEPNMLGIELTESTIIENRETAIWVLSNLKQIGIRTAIDDFGSGQAGINYLTDFRLDIVKFDKSFSDQFLIESKMDIYNTIILLTKKLGFIALAEGIEKKSQIDLLSATSCRLVQGYFYYKPLSSNKIAKILSKE